MRNLLDKSSVAQSLDVKTRLKGSLRFPHMESTTGGLCVQPQS
jgi:hypothetical protein